MPHNVPGCWTTYVDSAALQSGGACWGVQLLKLAEERIAVTQCGGNPVEGVAAASPLATDIQLLQREDVCVDALELFDDAIQLVATLNVPLCVPR